MAFSNQDQFGNYFATLGAAAVPLTPCFGRLTSDINRYTDVKLPAADLERLVYLPIFEDMIINQLFETDEKYDDDAAYSCVPYVPGPNSYNSNGYVSGLLQVVGLPLPQFPRSRLRSFGLGLLYPGFFHPLPAQYFQP